MAAVPGGQPRFQENEAALAFCRNQMGTLVTPVSSECRKVPACHGEAAHHGYLATQTVNTSPRGRQSTSVRFRKAYVAADPPQVTPQEVVASKFALNFLPRSLPCTPGGKVTNLPVCWVC